MSSNAPPSRDLLPHILLVLTATTGLVDAVSVLGLGRVFTANMTGNVVFLGFAAAGVPGYSAWRCATALFAFLVGAVGGGRLATSMAAAPYRRWVVAAALIEGGLFLVAAAASIDYDPKLMTPTWRLAALLILTAFAMGVRNSTVRRLAVADLTTTVLTLTLTGLGADSILAGGTNPRWRRRTLSVLAMLIGAVTGALLVLRSGVTLPLLLIGFIVIVAALVYSRHPSSLRTA
jgi:uncharacterized membrane protein YoaK (UPF0700 family)